MIYVHVIVIFIDVHTYMSINNTENENAFTPSINVMHHLYLFKIYNIDKKGSKAQRYIQHTCRISVKTHIRLKQGLVLKKYV